MENNQLILEFNPFKKIKDKVRTSLGGETEEQTINKIKEYIKNGSKGNLNIIFSDIKQLPPELTYVGGDLLIDGCANLTSLPDNLKVDGGFMLVDCKRITSLPNNLKVDAYIQIVSCKNLTSIDVGSICDVFAPGNGLNLEDCASLTTIVGNFEANYIIITDCKKLTTIGDNIKVNIINIINCRNLNSLPSDLQVEEDVYLEDTPLCDKTEEEIREMCPGIKSKIGGLIKRHVESFSRFVSSNWKKFNS